MERIILASASPRRAELLKSAQLDFEVSVPNIDEKKFDGESPEDLVKRLSLSKAKAVSAKFPEHWVLGADTTVALAGKIFEKPKDEADAEAMLLELSAKEHEVWGGIALVHRPTAQEAVEAHVSYVEFVKISTEDARSYVATGEPLDKAGAYGIQAGAARFVSKIRGSYTNIVGLNLSALLAKLKYYKVI